MDDLLKKLGISKDSEFEEIIEELKEANTEYLERIESCKDSSRLKEYRSLQAQIEQAIYDLSHGITQTGKTGNNISGIHTDMQKAKSHSSIKPSAVMPQTIKTGSTSDAAAKGDSATVKTQGNPHMSLDLALIEAGKALNRGDYKYAAQVIQPYAKRYIPDACFISACCLEMSGNIEAAEKMYFYAAERGNKTAALNLALRYSKENNYKAALEWGKKAYDPAKADSIAILANIYANLKNYIDAYRCFRDHMYVCMGYEKHNAREKMDLYLKLIIDNTNDTRKKNRILGQLIRESKDSEEIRKLREASFEHKKNLPKTTPKKIFSGVLSFIKLLPAIAVTVFVLFLAGSLVYYIAIGWAHPYKTEGGYAVRIDKRTEVEIPERVLFTPVVAAWTVNAKRVYVPESLEKLTFDTYGYTIDYVGAVGDAAKSGGVRVPASLKELIIEYSITVNGKNQQELVRFDFSRAKMLQELRITHIRTIGGLDLSAAPNLASVKLKNVCTEGELIFPASANVEFSMSNGSYADKLVVPENAEIASVYVSESGISTEISAPSAGTIEFPETAYIGSLSVTLTGAEAFIVPEKVRIDNLTLSGCRNVPMMEIGKGVGSAYVYESAALETLIVKGAETELLIRNNPKLVRLEILSDCDKIRIDNNALLEEITLRISDPRKLEISADDEYTTNAVRLLRVPPDNEEAYRTYFADVYPDMRIVGIQD